jgi:hypothetical protein
MNLLHLIFNAINPDGKVTWISQRYHRWERSRMKRQNENYRKNNNVPSIYFEVSGAGDICMSESCHDSTGQVIGFSFGVEWGRYGFFGGVIGRDEAKRMAEFILQKCAETTETMQEERERILIERDKYFKSSPN